MTYLFYIVVICYLIVSFILIHEDTMPYVLYIVVKYYMRVGFILMN